MKGGETLVPDWKSIKYLERLITETHEPGRKIGKYTLSEAIKLIEKGEDGRVAEKVRKVRLEERAKEIIRRKEWEIEADKEEIEFMRNKGYITENKIGITAEGYWAALDWKGIIANYFNGSLSLKEIIGCYLKELLHSKKKRV